MFFSLKRWFKKFTNCLSECIIAFIITVAGYTFLLYFFKMLWKVYSETEICIRFQYSNELIFNAVNATMHQNLLFFSFDVSLLAAKICLALALTSHLFLVKRWLYDPRGFIGRILCFGFPCAAVTAFFMQKTHANVDFYFCLLPTLALFSYCFKLVSHVVPGFDDLISAREKPLKSNGNGKF